jgi:phage terminase large subunit-like protein
MTEKDKVRKGRVDPTLLIALPGSYSLAGEAIEIYEKTGRRALEWQEKLLERIMYRGEHELWTHASFGYSIPRRNGKNEVVAIREMWGLVAGEKILHTAHRTSTSRMAWERMQLLLDMARIDYSVSSGIGKEKIIIESTGGRVDFRTRSTKGGLGEGFDLLVIDEAQEYTEEQQSALKYVVTDSRNPQTIYCGTPPTPESVGTVFTGFRTRVIEGRSVDSGWAEWSVDEVKDPWDKDAWYEANPSLGSVITERAVAQEITSDDLDFNIQRLGYWVRYNQKSAITKTDWEELRAKPNEITLVGKVFLGIKFGIDGKNTAVSLAVKTEDGRILIEGIDCKSQRSGMGWVLDLIRDLDLGGVVIDGAGAQMMLRDLMEEAGIREKPVLPTVKQVIKANSMFEQGIYRGRIVHFGQPSMEAVATNCEKRNIGSSGGFGYRSQIEDLDISLLDSAMLAYWLASEAKPKKKQKISY